MAKRTYYYARVSTKKQNLDRQVEEFLRMGANERDIIVDKVSGKNFERLGYIALKENLLREGDTLVVKELDRFGRNKQQIKSELEYFKEHGIKVKILDIPTTLIDTDENSAWISELITNLLIEVMASLAEQELKRNKQRQAEGIAEARKKGKKLGRPKIEVPDNWEEVVNDWRAGKITAVEAMRRTGIKKDIFYRWVKEAEDKET